MKPLISLNIVLAVVLFSIIAVILIERQQARNHAIAQSIEALEQIILEQAKTNHIQLQLAWQEGFMAADKWHNNVVKSFEGAKGKLDPFYLRIEYNKRFWSGTNTNPYR